MLLYNNHESLTCPIPPNGGNPPPPPIRCGGGSKD